VVDRTPADQDKVFFGAWVLLETEDGEEIEYRIVGADETDPEKRTISVDSPMARALLGRTLGDEIEVVLPDSTRKYRLAGIRYA
jgi:transcription elongation factor GreB